MFAGGRLHNSYKLAKVQRDAAELAYAEAIQHALGNVAVQLYRALEGAMGNLNRHPVWAIG